MPFFIKLLISSFILLSCIHAEKPLYDLSYYEKGQSYFPLTQNCSSPQYANWSFQLKTENATTSEELNVFIAERLRKKSIYVHQEMIIKQKTNKIFDITTPVTTCSKDFDSTNLQIPQATIINREFSYKFVNKEKINFSFLQQHDELKIVLINGLLYRDMPSENLKGIRSHLNNINQIEKMDKNSIKQLDLAVTTTFTLMHLMRKLATNIDWKVKEFTDYFVFETTGQLKHSRKKFNFKIYLGPTISLHGNNLHWNFLKKAMGTADFVFYNGHAEKGKTFSLQQIKKNSNFTNFSNSPQHQLYAILSCSSLKYFGSDIAKARSKLGKVTDLMLTGFDNQAYEVVAQLIQYLDLDLDKKNYSLSSIINHRYNDPEFFFQFSRYRP